MMSWWYNRRSAEREFIMKRTNVYLDEEQARVLRHLAIEEGRSFTDLVREALTGYLAQRGLDFTSRATGPRYVLAPDEWRSRFADVLGQIRAKTPTDLTSGAIEAEITTAREEVRRERAKQRESSPSQRG
jgi:hypothetical protein